MNKNILKKGLIIIGLVLLGLNFIMFLVEEKNIFEALFGMGYESFNYCGKLEGVLLIVGLVFLIGGLILKSDNISSTSKKRKNLIMKYRLLRILGYLPFVGILCFASYHAIYGLTFFGNTCYGFTAFMLSILNYSQGLWPHYIIGVTLIIKSYIEIRSLKNKTGLRNPDEE